MHYHKITTNKFCDNAFFYENLLYRNSTTILLKIHSKLMIKIFNR